MTELSPPEIAATADAWPGSEASDNGDGNSFKFGRVVFVAGSQVVAMIDEAVERKVGTAGPDQLQLGSLIKMRTAVSTVFGVISGLSIPVPAENSSQRDIMIAEIELLGEVTQDAENKPFALRRGVSAMPQLNDSVYTTTKEDLRQVYARPQAATARIGSIHQDRDVPTYIITNDLLGKHFAILGTTGCGKSCATALILHALIEQNPNSHIVLLDPHNEYTSAFSETAEVLNPQSLELPYWMLDFEEFLEIISGGGGSVGPDEVAILSELIPTAKRSYAGATDVGIRITVDTPIPYRMNDLIQLLDEAMGKLNKTEGVAPYQRLKTKFKAMQADSRYAFMFGGVGVRDNMDKILAHIFRIPVDGKPITIIDLSGVPSEIVNVVVSTLCRITFDFALWSNGEVPVLLVCEEAHRYASQSDAQGFEPTKRALSRIAKEGRKYGVSLCLISQRPSELATGILSQCNTIFAMRMTNQADQDILSATMSDSSLGLSEALPSLGNAEAVAVGEGVAVPVRLCFDELPEGRRPRSATADFHSAWQGNLASEDLVKGIVERWRQQGR